MQPTFLLLLLILLSFFIYLNGFGLFHMSDFLKKLFDGQFGCFALRHYISNKI